jgi:hypothetical protein
MSVPKKHHFLPEFFLKKWRGSDLRVVQFHRPHETKFASVRRFPSETGFERFLYSLGNLPVEEAQEIETEFFSLVDDRASIALDALYVDGHLPKDLEDQWWRFVATLMTRMPSDVRKYRSFRQKLANEVLPILEGVKSLPDFTDRAPEIESAAAAVKQDQIDTSTRGLAALMSKERLLGQLRNLNWKVVSTHQAPFELLTSDRPVAFYPEQAFLMMLPIGPNLLFVASKDNNTVRKVENASKNVIVREVNAAIVGSAEQYVIGRTETQRGYIAANMGKSKSRSFMDMLEETVEKELPGITEGLQEAFRKELKDAT